MNIGEIPFWFSIYCFLGWMIDSGYQCLHKKRWLPEIFTYFPFYPIYGFGALLTLYLHQQFFATYPFWVEASVLGLSLGAIEYLGGVFVLKFFKRRIWDYSGHLLNIQGHTDVLHTILWAWCAISLIYWLHPFLQTILLMNQPV